MSKNTEAISSKYRGLDTWETSEILSALWDGQMRATASVLPALPSLSRSIEAATHHLQATKGRLIYVGAGSSGVISLLDSLELGSTFNWPEDRMVVVLPGGTDLTNGLSDAVEDSGDVAVDRINALNVCEADVVIGVSASGAVEFTLQALKRARSLGALTVGFANNSHSDMEAVAQYVVVAETGAEVIAGSTRMGAGTAQKILFNLFSTTLMTQLGAVHDNLMVNVRPANKKLQNRCVTMTAQIAEVSEQLAAEALAELGSVKRAVLGLAGVPAEQIDGRLHTAKGVLRHALQSKASGT